MDKISGILRRFGCRAVIFDLDGTILDNNSFHLKAWKQYLAAMGREMTDEEYNKNINGRTNSDVVKYLYGQDISDELLWKHTHDKEKIYRDLYQPHILPLTGLLPLLDKFQALNIPMAIATSGIQVNIDFMFEHVPIRKYFRKIVDSSYITRGKPDPEIFLKAAAFLDVPPAECVVFEDAVVGIRSAKTAGMKVIAVETTHLREELVEADMIIRDYTEMV